MNDQKTPLALSLNKFARAKAQDATWGLGKGLPCTVAAVVNPGIVTVNFEVATSPFTLPQITMPVAKPPYIQYPIQVGDKGVAFSADVRTGAMSGLGSGVPSLQDTVGNLSAMTFVWLGHVDETFLDPDAMAVNGNILVTPTDLSFFAGGKVAQQTVTGALSAITDANAKAVLTSLIHALANYNLIVNGTS